LPYADGRHKKLHNSVSSTRIDKWLIALDSAWNSHSNVIYKHAKNKKIKVMTKPNWVIQVNMYHISVSSGAIKKMDYCIGISIKIQFQWDIVTCI